MALAPAAPTEAREHANAPFTVVGVPRDLAVELIFKLRGPDSYCQYRFNVAWTLQFFLVQWAAACRAKGLELYPVKRTEHGLEAAAARCANGLILYPLILTEHGLQSADETRQIRFCVLGHRANSVGRDKPYDYARAQVRAGTWMINELLVVRDAFVEVMDSVLREVVACGPCVVGHVTVGSTFA